MFQQISAVFEDYLKTLQKNDTTHLTSTSNSSDRSSMEGSGSNHVNDKSLAVLVDGLEAVSGIYLDAIYPAVEYISDLNPTIILNMLSMSPEVSASVTVLHDSNQQQQQQHVSAAIENYQQKRVKLYDTLLDCFKYVIQLHGGSSNSSNKTNSSNSYNSSMSNNSYISNNSDKKIDSSRSNVVLQQQQQQQTQNKIANNYTEYQNQQSQSQSLPPVKKQQQLPDLLGYLQHDTRCLSKKSTIILHNDNNDNNNNERNDVSLSISTHSDSANNTILPTTTNTNNINKVKDFYSTNRVHVYLTDKGLVCRYHEKKAVAADVCKKPKFDQVEYLFDSLLHANYNYNNQYQDRDNTTTTSNNTTNVIDTYNNITTNDNVIDTDTNITTNENDSEDHQSDNDLSLIDDTMRVINLYI